MSERRNRHINFGHISAKVVLATEYGLTSVTVWVADELEMTAMLEWAAGPRTQPFVSKAGEFSFPPGVPILYVVRGA